MKHKSKYNAALIAVSAMFAALLVGGKEALAALPNVEVVTLLIAICAYVWGPLVVFPAVNVFIAVDMAIWGVNTWIISYFIHWNTVAIIYWLLSKLQYRFAGRHKAVEVTIVTLAAAIITTLFGVLTSAVDTLVGYTGKGFFVDGDNFLARFSAMYVAGSSFYVTQIVCNIVLFATAFTPLVTLNRKAQLRMSPKDTSSDETNSKAEEQSNE
ncbi:MAG: hypothetical protein J1G02_05230 [Clostridiales bacterium]|nr:hypothetical protein [Clostridiales bacterium]